MRIGRRGNDMIHLQNVFAYNSIVALLHVLVRKPEIMTLLANPLPKDRASANDISFPEPLGNQNRGEYEGESCTVCTFQRQSVIRICFVLKSTQTHGNLQSVLLDVLPSLDLNCQPHRRPSSNPV